MVPSCCVCYEPSISKCFAGCANYVCIECLTRLIEINEASMIYFRCPCCRQEIIKNINENFTDFCYREIEVLKRLVSLLEKEISEKKKIHLDQAWTIFEATLIDIETNEL